MGKTSIVGTFLVISLILAILSAIVAWRKGDFASRGAAIGALIGPFGLLFLLMAPRSKAAAGDPDDLQHWHIHSAAGGWLYLAAILLTVVYLSWL